MADYEEPLVLDSQEERELRTQVCQQAAEVCVYRTYACTNLFTSDINYEQTCRL